MSPTGAPSASRAPGSKPQSRGGPGGARPWKNRGAGRPQDANGPRPPHGESRRTPAGAQQGQRPARSRHNFDEVQPQSNANAAPFGRTTLTAPSGAPRGYGNETGPRHRSGPRAHKAGNANGHARGNASTGYVDRREGSQDGQKAAERPVPHTLVRTKRQRALVHVVPRPDSEANGNVAPRSEPPVTSDDES